MFGLRKLPQTNFVTAMAVWTHWAYFLSDKANTMTGLRQLQLPPAFPSPKSVAYYLWSTLG